MKLFICALFFIGAFSASASLIPLAKLAKAAVPLFDFANSHIKINATQFWIGFNQQLNLVTNDAALNCAGDFLPTLEELNEVSQLIMNFRFGPGFNEIDPLIATLQKFKGECQPVYQAYGKYFNNLATAWVDDQQAVLRTFVHTLADKKEDAIIRGAEIAAAIAGNDSVAAGQAFVTFLKLGLSSYLPY